MRVDLAGQWHFRVDRGGTFTDVIARQPDGRLLTCKLLSENPEQYPDAVLAGIRQLLRIGREAPVPAALIGSIRMGTTVATNALLEHKGEPVLLVVTRGFADVLRIGYQSRPDLFTLDIRLPQMLYTSVIEVDERLDAGGHVLRELDESQVLTDLQAGFDAGLRSCAIVLMHSYRNADHENRIAALAIAICFTQVSVSSQLSPVMKIVSRGDTTAVDAYLSPILQRYIAQVSGQLQGLAEQPGRLLFMQSNGGLTDARCFNGKDAILSGPAGGVIGMVKTGEAAGVNRLIGFDMGGTFTDVCHYRGAYERTTESVVAGFRLQTPMLAVHTIAAGGGSIVRFDGARYRVGPESAGAVPGPACYRRGGPLTITDCNVMLGKIRPEYFPAVFGPTGDQPLDSAIVRQQFECLAEDIRRQTGDNRTPAAVAEGFLTIAVDNMAHAIKHISTQRGHDVQDYTLCSFGGAGSQHACLVADALGIRRILLHPHAGVLSALGMDLADIRELAEATVEQPLTAATLQHLSDDIAACQQRLRQRLLDQGVPPQQMRCETSLRIKADGSDFPFLLPYGHCKELTTQFRHEHQQRFGFAMENPVLLVQSFQVEAIGRLNNESLAEALATQVAGVESGPATVDSGPAGVYSRPATDGSEPSALGFRPPSEEARHEVVFSGRPVETPFRYRDSLLPGEPLPGPAVIIEANSTIVIEPGWQAVLQRDHNLLLTRCEPRPVAHTAGIQTPVSHSASIQARVSQAAGIQADPVLLEVFNNLFMFIAEQMGLVLQNTAVSVNIKERLDFSCAIFNAAGDLVANAPHMPVHLGSMSHSIKSVINKNRRSDGRTTLQPGDVIMLNDPYSGGTHLPDITVIKPVFNATGPGIDFYVASRGHHADIGGRTPGSMPSDSRHIDEEGILLDNVKVVAGGIFQEDLVRETFLQARWPARNIDMTLADLKAQIAACEAGIHALAHIVRDYGDKVVQAYMRHVQDNAETAVRRVIETLPNGNFSYAMDNGCEIRVSIHTDKAAATATIDFTGTSAQHDGNFNAPLAVVHAAVLYVFRCLVQDNIPLNEGCLKPLHIIVPEGCLLNPRYPAAVVAGNVEVSQAIVDTLLGALGVKAAAQGTMNNLTFGNERYQYYETLCGGDGATASADGASAVHTHMTNSRLTDPEVLESRFPVLLEQFAVRPASGGSGHHRGGDGIVRAIRFLEAMEVNLLTNRRQVAPFGLAGGEPGQPGSNTLLCADHPDRETRLPSQCTLQVRPGDTLVIATPGGGGFGSQ